MEQELVERAGVAFTAISVMAVRGKNPFAMLSALWTLGRGYRQSLALIQQFQPEAVFVTGGYVCVPITLAARRFGVPVIIYLPDIKPGLAIQFLARFATRVAVTAPAAQAFFKPNLTVVTGYPVRAELLDSTPQRKAEARQQLGLSADEPTLLVFGGSRGARAINQAITRDLEAYLQISQIVHITGMLDIDEVMAKRQKLAPELQARYHVFAYLHEEMTAALLAADLVVSRAGASVLGEFPAMGLPSILIPYPHAGAHQTLNAQYLVEHQAAILVQEVDIIRVLRETIITLTTNPQTLAQMSRACYALAKPKAATHLAEQILEVKNHYGS